MKKLHAEINELITFKNSQGLAARGTLLKISHNYIVFETYNPYSIVQLSEVINSVKISRAGKEIYSGKAVVSNLINTGLLLIVSATLVDSWSGQFEPDDSVNVAEEAVNFVDNWSRLNEGIPNDYQLAVGRMRSFLMDSNRWIEQFDVVDEQGDRSSVEFLEDVKSPFIEKMSNLMYNFEIEAKTIDNSQEGVCKRFAQQELHPFIMQSPFIHRTFYKPLGYAGDYEMVNMMLRNPYEGETAYSKLLNSSFLKAGPAEAHRNRIDILYNKLKEIASRAANAGVKVRIFNFACGPAIEVQRFIEKEEVSESCEFTLLDFSKETIDYTKGVLDEIKLRTKRDVKINFVNRSAHDVLKEAVGLVGDGSNDDDSFDFIYCAGLFDYLSDKVCSKLLKLFFYKLKNNGRLMATNVHSSNPSRNFMEHLMEWYLIYRDEGQFSELAPKAAREKEIYFDKTGFNIFIEASKVVN